MTVQDVLSEDNILHLKCTTSGPPSYLVQWYIGNTLINPSCHYTIASNNSQTSVLTIHNATSSIDSGIYRCTAHSYYTTLSPTAVRNVTLTGKCLIEL